MSEEEKGSYRKIVREQPEYRAGRLTEKEADEIADMAYAAHVREQEAEIRRVLMRLAARGEAEYDAARGVWHYTGS